MWGDYIKNSIRTVALLLVITMACASVTSAQSSFLSSFNQHYDTYDTKLDSCDVCHSGPNGGGSLDPYGRAYSGSGRNFASIEDLDSDGDGFTNLEEIDALTFPGDSSDFPEITAEPVSEPIINETDMAVNESAENQNTSEEVEIQEEDTEETTNETSTQSSGTQSSGTQSPGFEIIFAIAGILSIAYLNGRR